MSVILHGLRAGFVSGVFECKHYINSSVVGGLGSFDSSDGALNVYRIDSGTEYHGANSIDRRHDC